MIKKLKKRLATLSLAFSSVEKNALSQNSNTLESNNSIVSEKDTGTLAHSLKNNIVNEEVSKLRYRMYKILDETSNRKTKVTGYDEDGFPITETFKIDKTLGLKKIKVDSFDNYPLEILFKNELIVLGVDDSLNGVKNEKTLKVSRTTIPKFEIENYSDRLNVRGIDTNKKLLEFYISKNKDTTNTTNRLFNSEISKISLKPRNNSFLDINEVEFISDSITIGVDEFKQFKYKIESFDKIVEFNGYYVIKFLASVLIDGESLTDKFKNNDLEEKYRLKEKKLK